MVVQASSQEGGRWRLVLVPGSAPPVPPVLARASPGPARAGYQSSVKTSLKGAPALLVNMAEALALLALLEQARRGHDEDGVDADHAEHGGEDVVEEDVGERGDGRGAPAHEGRGRGAGARRVGDEGGRGTVEVAAAGELGGGGGGC